MTCRWLYLHLPANFQAKVQKSFENEYMRFYTWFITPEKYMPRQTRRCRQSKNHQNAAQIL